MQLKEIYRPIEKELGEIDRNIRFSVSSGGNKAVLTITDYLLRSGGKRLRPALVALSARAALCGKPPASISHQVIKVASAVELIHLASLIHDDVVDHSEIRHNKPTINSRWGEDVSLILGDYLYSVGFDLISSCNNPDILSCFSQATRLMCEGELIQVCERDNLDILKERYINVVKKKTASLFAASCQAGAIVSTCQKTAQRALKEYGLNLGIAFQIVDDSLDLIGTTDELGKAPGADFKMGELTLPILNLLGQHRNGRGIMRLVRQRDNRAAFEEIKNIFLNSKALFDTKKDVSRYAQRAKINLNKMPNSSFKQGLLALADYIVARLGI